MFDTRHDGSSAIGFLHPNTLTLPHWAWLLLRAALEGWHDGLMRLHITAPILASAQRLVLTDAPDGAHYLVAERLGEVLVGFDGTGLVHESALDTWAGTLDLPEPGDNELVEVASETKADFVVTQKPHTLPRSFIEHVGCQVVTPNGLLFALHETNRDLLVRVLDRHREKEDMSPYMFREYLKSWGMAELCEVVL